MNSISFSPPPKVFLDTTVLCGALRKPEGLQSDLLKFAGTSVILQPIISQVCLLEFYRNALNGLGNLIYSDQEIRLFLNEYIDPILDGVYLSTALSAATALKQFCEKTGRSGKFWQS